MKQSYVTLQIPKPLRDELRLIAAELSAKHSERVTMTDILADAILLLAEKHRALLGAKP